MSPVRDRTSAGSIGFASALSHRAIVGASLLLSTAIGSGGCIASTMARHGYNPGRTWLQPGVTRADVDRNLGKPLTESRLPDGHIVATYEYGISRPNRGVEFMHFMFEGLTGGLWLVPGGIIEVARARAGDPVKVTVVYGEDNRIVSAQR